MMTECEERTLPNQRAVIEHFGPSFCSSFLFSVEMLVLVRSEGTQME